MGLGVEVFTMAALTKAFAETSKDYERDHVTPYCNLHPEKFALRSFSSRVDLSHYRWTLDTPEDLLMVQTVYAALYKPGQLFSTQQVLRFLDAHPEVAKTNAHIEQKALPIDR